MTPSLISRSRGLYLGHVVGCSLTSRRTHLPLCEIAPKHGLLDDANEPTSAEALAHPLPRVSVPVIRGDAAAIDHGSLNAARRPRVAESVGPACASNSGCDSSRVLRRRFSLLVFSRIDSFARRVTLSPDFGRSVTAGSKAPDVSARS